MVVLALLAHTPALAAFALAYLLPFLDKRGDLGCGVAVTGMLVSAVLVFYASVLVGLGGAGPGWSAGAKRGLFLLGVFLGLQALLAHGAWRYSRAESDSRADRP